MPTTTKIAPPDLSKMARLTLIEIQFHTNGDDKDQDTLLTVTFEEGTQVFATLQPTNQVIYDTLGEEHDDFSDGETTSWMTVPMNTGTTMLKPALALCSTTVRIDPQGNDTWRFNYWTRLHYSDGTMDERHFDGHALSQNVRENTFPLK